MDVQGSQYHLLRGLADWATCVDEERGATLGEFWALDDQGLPSTPDTSLTYDRSQNVLRLRRETPLFHRAGRTSPLAQSARRGAGADSYGNWYWIGADRTSILWRPAAAHASATWWSASDQARSCAQDAAPAPGGPGAFRTCAPGWSPDLALAGLAVTTRHYLLVGYIAQRTVSEVDEAGLLVFDLQAGGEPLRMPWPAETRFDPWDLAETGDGGALVLDRTHAMYWRLDGHLRVRGWQPHRAALFQPAESRAGREFLPGPAIPIGIPLTSPDLRSPINAVSIEPGPDGGVLVLDSDSVRGYSYVHLFEGDALVWSVSLADSMEVVEPDDPTYTPHRYSLLGHDFAYSVGPLHPGSGEPGLLYVADSEGKQVVAFQVEAVGAGATARRTVIARTDFLPLRRWDGKALVRHSTDVFYDFGDRWVPIAAFQECRFAISGVLTTPAGFSDPLGTDAHGGLQAPRPAGSPFDSQLPGCVWHRLLLDAQIPGGTSITVRARAHDDPGLLAQAQWLPQPAPYLRSDGPELPWYDPWADLHSAGPLPDRIGTWELLFQQVTGRYAEIELTVAGNGRSSPLLRSVRAWYPRFSYPDHYLPTVYQASDSADRFLERFLANFEGMYTAIEERIEHSHLLLDPRTALSADLPWLAAWFGLALDPLWDEQKRRFLIRNVDRFYRIRGTVPGLVSTLRVYLEDAATDDVFCAGPVGSGGIRVVERFLTRNTLVPGGPPDPADELTRVTGAAHRFDVLVPAALDPGDLAMVWRIVSATRPAHTWFDVRQYSDLFVVGSARLGSDTELGDSPSFVPLITGSGELAASYLGYPRPFDITDRIVADRDRISDMPAL
jgi:phage tail-like protein